MFKKGDKLIRIIDVHGIMSATIETVEFVKKGVVCLEDSNLTYSNENGSEIDPGFPAGSGIRSFLVMFDGGEVERWNLQ